MDAIYLSDAIGFVNRSVNLLATNKFAGTRLDKPLEE